MQVCCCGSSPLSQSLQPLPCNCAAIAPVIAAFAPGSPATCVPVTAARRRRRSGATSRNRRNQPPQAGQQRLGSAAISCNGHNQPPQAPWPRWERHSSDSDERPGLRPRQLGYGRLGRERPGLSRLRSGGGERPSRQAGAVSMLSRCTSEPYSRVEAPAAASASSASESPRSENDFGPGTGRIEFGVCTITAAAVFALPRSATLGTRQNGWNIAGSL